MARASLGGARAKVRRGQAHLRTLNRAESEFAANAYRVYTQLDEQAGEVIIWAEARREPPSTQWGAILGDVVHNLRSALDHLVFALSEAESGPAPRPIPPKSRWRDVAFPVVRDSQNWKSAATQKLWAIDQHLVADVQRLQPFSTGQNAPDREPLAVLEELWKIDKHRHLHLVNATVELSDALPPSALRGFADDIGLNITSKRAPGPFEGRTEVGRVVQTGPGLVVPQVVYVDPDIAIDVVFDQGPPAYGGSLRQTLSQVSATVEAIVTSF